MVHGTNSSAVDATSPTDSAGLSTASYALTEILRTGAQKMLSAAIEREVADYIEDRKSIVDESGRRLVVRNGHLPEREILTGLGLACSPNPDTCYEFSQTSGPFSTTSCLSGSSQNQQFLA